MRTKFIPYIVAAATLTIAPVAHATPVFVSYENGDFGTINLTDGSFNLIAANDPSFFGMGLTAGNVLQGITSNGNLYSIDMTTGAATFIKNEGVEAEGAGSNGSGTLYFSQFSTQGDNLYTAPGPTLVGNPGVPSDGLDAFNSEGVLYIDEFNGGTNPDTLFSVDPGTGNLTSGGVNLTGEFGPNPYNAQIFTGVFDNGQLYGFGDDNVSTNFNIYTINTTTGNTTFATPEGNAGTESNPNPIDAVALGTPEPSTTMAYAIGVMTLLGFVAVGRRRKAIRAV